MLGDATNPMGFMRVILSEEDTTHDNEAKTRSRDETGETAVDRGRGCRTRRAGQGRAGSPAQAFPEDGTQDVRENRGARGSGDSGDHRSSRRARPAAANRPR